MGRPFDGLMFLTRMVVNPEEGQRDAWFRRLLPWAEAVRSVRIVFGPADGHYLVQGGAIYSCSKVILISNKVYGRGLPPLDVTERFPHLGMKAFPPTS